MIFRKKKDSPASGSTGEEAAREYLLSKGYEIIAHNLRLVGVELDIIARSNDILCFIEVKTRLSDSWGRPEEFVDTRKQKRILRAASLFASRPAYRDLRMRFDVIAVSLGPSGPGIEYFEDAFGLSTE